jgi:hypothetical protein
MKTTPLSLLLCLPVLALAHGHGVPDEDYPDLAKHRFCQRMTDIALQALYDRDQGRPAKTFPEDGSDSARIGNGLVRKIYEEPGISSPKRAMAVGRGYCLEQLQATGR